MVNQRAEKNEETQTGDICQNSVNTKPPIINLIEVMITKKVKQREQSIKFHTSKKNSGLVLDFKSFDISSI